MTSHNPLHNDRPQIFMLAVLRFSDKIVVATYSTSREVTKEGIRECVAGNAMMTQGRRYTSQGETQSIHYLSDAQGRVYAVVTNPTYPPRVAFAALTELQSEFAEVGPKVATSVEEGLSKTTRATLKTIVEKFADPSKADNLVSLQDKLDVVKTVMKDNIQQILINVENLEKIEASATQLNKQSDDFRKNTKVLTNKMWWKMWKMRILIGGLITAVLLIIIVPIAVTQSAAANSKE